jgi:hypothetical protein
VAQNHRAARIMFRYLLGRLERVPALRQEVREVTTRAPRKENAMSKPTTSGPMSA